MSILSRRFLPLALLALPVITPLRATAHPTQTGDPDDLVLGIWVLNLEESSFDPGPPPTSQTRIYEPQADRVKATIKTVDPDGHAISSEYVAGYDSLEYPITGSPNIYTIALRRVNAYVAEATLKHADSIIGVAERVIARDGKSMTITYRGADRQGQQVEIRAVYDKQPGR